MNISSAIVDTAMQMDAMQFAAEYSTGVMKAEMDFMEDIGNLLTQQLMQLDVGPAPSQLIDVYA